MSAPIIMGIDPGFEGAIAFLAGGAPHVINVSDMPIVGTGKQRSIDLPSLARLIRAAAPDIAVVELVGSMPKQGLSSTFKFGTGYGAVQGVIAALGIPIHFVGPARWKKHFRLAADKEMARAAAIRLWPTTAQFGLKKHAGRAEAALIARYALETFPNMQTPAGYRLGQDGGGSPLPGSEGSRPAPPPSDPSAPASTAGCGAARPGGGLRVAAGEAADSSSPRATGVPA